MIADPGHLLQLSLVRHGETEWSLSGQHTLDIRKERPEWNVFRDGCPGGEMPSQLSERADRLIARLLALDGNVALFSHGQFGCSLAARWIGVPVIEAQHFVLGAGSLGILGHEPHHPTVRVIALWNATPLAKASPTRSPCDRSSLETGK